MNRGRPGFVVAGATLVLLLVAGCSSPAATTAPAPMLRTTESVTAASIAGVWVSEVDSSTAASHPRLTLDVRRDGRMLVLRPAFIGANEVAWKLGPNNVLTLKLFTRGFGEPTARYGVKVAGDRMVLRFIDGQGTVLRPGQDPITLRRVASGPTPTASLLPSTMSTTLRDADANLDTKLMGTWAQARARELAGSGWTQASSLDLRRVLYTSPGEKLKGVPAWILVMRDVPIHRHGPSARQDQGTRALVFDANTGERISESNWLGR